MKYLLTLTILSFGLAACKVERFPDPSPDTTSDANQNNSLALKEQKSLKPHVPVIRSTDLEVLEGDQRNPVVALRVTLSEASHVPVGVSYQTLDGTAVSPGHFEANRGRLIFAPGEVYKNLEIQVYSDTVANGDRSFFVKLYSPTNAVISESGKYRIDIVDDLSDAPSVTGIAFSANLESKSFVAVDSGDGAAQLKNIAVRNVRFIKINFSTDVDISRDDLSISNSVGGTHYDLTEYFNYDAEGYFAIWEISSSVSADRLSLTLNANRIRAKFSGVQLDGTWINPANYDDLKTGSTFPSGGSGPGQNFIFNVNFMTCDLDQNDTVNHEDMAELWEKLKVDAYESHLDINQDSELNELDIKACETFIGSRLATDKR